ncbi:MAG TPA: 2-oxoglutarate dehydrogenase, E2 component, dihydrolipoamide succinyltransferase, partial [Jatrophihabitans sp.]|nr:2-oxoglutarate dehydrogenase, E2 component, dihydrolipoamide succinyltransferase [Jatrophihabitans sp.]
VLTSIKVAEDETVEIGVELAVISEAGEDSGSGSDSDSDSSDEAEPADSAPEETASADSAPEETAPADSEPEPAAAEQRPEPAAAAPAPAAPAPAAPAAAPPAAAPPAAAPAQAPAATAPTADAQAEDDEIAGTYVTPLVRKLASEHGVDLNALTGTGVGGRIRKSDVLNAANEAAQRKAEAEAAPPAAPAAAAPSADSPASPATTGGQAQPVLRGRTEKLSRLRQVIAARMVESLQTSAQLTTVVEVDVTRIARLRQSAKADFERREGVKLSFLPFFAIAAVEALKEHPNVNCSVDTEAGTVTYHEAEHLGIAVDTERGLLVPVIHNAGDLNLGGIARKIADLAERTRTNKVSPDELGGGTFTLTNTGSRGALFDTPIINQPQVAILGTGSVVKRPVVISDENLGETIAVRSMVYLALSYDHRIVDGADAARFLGTMKTRLEAGAFERALGLGQG